MIQLPCPWCGYRNVNEFAYLGESAHRPDPATTTPREWRTYLYMRANPAGPLTERWYHRAGCRKFFEAVRDTRDNTVQQTRKPVAQRESASPQSADTNAEEVPA